MKKILCCLLSLIMLTAVFTGCVSGSPDSSPSSTDSSAKDDSSKDESVDQGNTDAKRDVANEKIVIGVSQCHMNTPYRVALKTDIENYVKEKNLDWEIVFLDGQNDPAKQTSDVEDLISRKVDIILMSPVQSEPMTPVAQKVLDSGIPLILVDRQITTDDFTAYVGGDNVNVGKVVAEYFAEQLDGKGNIALIQGVLGASATTDRDNGFKETLEKYPDMKIIFDQTANGTRDEAMRVTENMLQANPEIDAIYFLADNMLLGGVQAIEAAGREGIILAGTDGQAEVGDLIKDGTVDCTAYYPNGAEEAIDLAIKILNGESFEKVNLLDTPLIHKENIEKWYELMF